MKTFFPALAFLAFQLSTALAGTEFIEAESFTSAGGWTAVSDSSTKAASGLATLRGGSGAADGVATKTVSIKDAGHYRIWVRYQSYPTDRGPFKVTALAGERTLGSELFDTQFEGHSPRDTETWKSFEAELPEGEVTLRLSKHENKNARGAARSVDCLLLTMDEQLVPNHLSYGAQTYVRVTFGEGYDRPVYAHVFADHFHAPWYQHYSLARDGAVASTAPKKEQMLNSGERTAWCSITPMIYQDSGTMLNISARHSYTEVAKRLRATFEFATAPDEKAIVRTIHADFEPAGFAIFLPPNLLTPENIALCKTDREIAEETGQQADAHSWPTYGKKPEHFPFFVTSSIESSTAPRDAAMVARERKTLDYFGYSEEGHRRISGVWFMKNKSYCQPDLAMMNERATAAAARFKAEGGNVKEITFCELMDEPTGQTLEVMAKDAAYQEHFRAWLKTMGRTPADLLVGDWEAVRTVTPDQRKEFPALYYFSQRFRTRALSEFMTVQRGILEKAYGRTLPTLANFSDGAVYGGNFCVQGVDYFELLDSPEQNAIWGEDWANFSSTYQCASYNVDLMRAAAREHGQIIGQHLIAHAGRKPWDIKLKATSEVARGVKIMNNFCYGPSWASHEGGPYWRSSLWYAKPEMWIANAAITREIGAVEDALLAAMPAPAKVALLYSTASDVWTIDGSLATGFERMHTWLALTHAQVPVDIVSEQQVAKGLLDGYSVCYFSGPNLTQAAAARLKQWVQKGGTLWLTAGAAARDEFDRPLSTLDDLLPAVREGCVDLQTQTGSGRSLRALAVKDEVRWDGGSAAVLAAKQVLHPREGANVLARFKDESPAVVAGSAGEGRIVCAGFLPALAYIKSALDARNAIEERVKADPTADTEGMLERSANPWEFPEELRRFILTPTRDAHVVGPIECSVPLVDAIYMPHEKGVLIPLANYTNRPIANLSLKVAVRGPVASVESAVHGRLASTQSPQGVQFSLPLDSNDFVTLTFR